MSDRKVVWVCKECSKKYEERLTLAGFGTTNCGDCGGSFDRQDGGWAIWKAAPKPKTIEELAKEVVASFANDPSDFQSYEGMQIEIVTEALRRGNRNGAREMVKWFFDNAELIEREGLKKHCQQKMESW